MYTADLHCDTISKIYHSRKRKEAVELRSNPFQVDIQKLRQGNYILQNFAVFVDLEQDGDPYQCAKDQIAVLKAEIHKNADKIRQVTSVTEILQNQAKGRISALLTLEEGEACKGDIKKLEEFYAEGVRMMTFTWNYDNSLGTKDGLTKRGITFLENMERLGILPDVSHLSEAGFYDVCRYSTKPFVASHSNAAALCGHKRNLTDTMIRMLAERGGIIGVNYYGLFLEEPKNGISCGRVQRIADHILHMIQIGGISCVGLGSDFDGFDGRLELSDCSKIELLETELRRRGLKNSEIEAVFYQNVLRIYKEI